MEWSGPKKIRWEFPPVPSSVAPAAARTLGLYVTLEATQGLGLISACTFCSVRGLWWLFLLLILKEFWQYIAVLSIYMKYLHLICTVSLPIMGSAAIYFLLSLWDFEESRYKIHHAHQETCRAAATFHGNSVTLEVRKTVKVYESWYFYFHVV